MNPITAIVLGAGQRGANVYAAYALSFPNELKIVGVAEPRADRRVLLERLARDVGDHRRTSPLQPLEIVRDKMLRSGVLQADGVENDAAGFRDTGR